MGVGGGGTVVCIRGDAEEGRVLESREEGGGRDKRQRRGEGEKKEGNEGEKVGSHDIKHVVSEFDT